MANRCVPNDRAPRRCGPVRLGAPDAVIER